MTQDEIIALAKRVGFPIHHPEWRKAVEEFAALVEEQAAAKEREAFAKIQYESLLQAMRIEREACAKECWKQMGLLPTQAWTVNPYEQCIDAIRARGEQA
jgi:hypothetical protein